MLFTIVFLALINQCLSHMSISFPKPRNNRGRYLTWELNEPLWPARAGRGMCHGLPRDNPVPSQNVFRAGQSINIQLAGSASHGGGHCAFWYSTNGGTTFYKLSDVKDCTTTMRGRTSVQLPSNMARQCGSSCVFAWTWVPAMSGACEIYINCADIRVSGVSGGHERTAVSKNFNSFLRAGTCKRVNAGTHFTSIFGPVNGRGGNSGGGHTAPRPTPRPTPRPATRPTTRPATNTGGSGGASCGSVAAWREGGTYKRGGLAYCPNTRRLYRCKYPSWCKGPKWAYSPCEGSAAMQAWSNAGACRSRAVADDLEMDLFDDEQADHGESGWGAMSVLVVSLATVVNVSILVWQCANARRKVESEW